MLGRIANNSGKSRMSLELAESVSTWSSRILIASLLTAVFSALLILLSRNAREAKLEEQVVALQKKVVDAKAEQSSIAAELQKLTTPRALTKDQQVRLAERLRPFAGLKYSLAVQPDREPINLMDQLIEVLTSAGWAREPWREGGGSIRLKRSSQTDVVAGIALFAGVRIEVAQSKAQEWASAVIALRDGLKAEGVEVIAKASPSALDDAIHVAIGKKP